MYGGSLPVGRFCASALRSLGHVVEEFEAPAFYSAYQAMDDLRVTSDRLDYLHNGFLQLVGNMILAKVQTFEPDLVLAMAQAPLSMQALRRLRKDGVPTAMWFVEDHRLFTYWKGFAPLYDVFAVIQREPLLSRLAEIGQANALYLPMAADPAFHRAMELPAAERRVFGSDVSFMGAGYPNRRMAFREFTRLDFKIWGTEWDGDHLLAPLVQMNGRRITSEECVKIFNASKINLNLHSSVGVEELVSKGDFVNPRTFEVAACSGFQLVDERGLLHECFAPDELATFTSLPELKEKMEYFLAHPEEREAIARRGRERVLREHTYAHRMERLLDFTAERLSGWPRPRQGAEAAQGLPPELAEEIGALVSGLGLPADVSFADLVWALRQRSGALSDMETAVLFLDEWRKTYVKDAS
jgi:spore maturation protein CgeB